VWVPRILSRHATGTYSWMRPPSRSRRSGRMVAPVSVGVHCRNHLAAYKTLTTWLFVDALPPTASHNDAADVCAVLFGAAGIAVACEGIREIQRHLPVGHAIVAGDRPAMNAAHQRRWGGAMTSGRQLVSLV